MNLTIRPMTLNDADAKGYVHWKSWQETYPGLVDADYLSKLSLEKCQSIAFRWQNHCLVAELNSKIVGFCSYGPCRDTDLPDSGEVMSIYLLKEAQGMGIGRKLMDAAFQKLDRYRTIAIWVLKGNHHAIGFYEHFGFRFDGISKDITIGTPNTELRLIYRR